PPATTQLPPLSLHDALPIFDTIDWLESYLKDFRGAVLVVSHDRAFLDAVCPRTLELGSRGMRDYPLRYSEYAIAREDDLARERADRKSTRLNSSHVSISYAV